MLTEPSRQAALERLEKFIPIAKDYAKNRNIDSTLHPTVSGLSPYLRNRVISEQEVFDALVTKQFIRYDDKFIQELSWRNYWRGWLKHHPDVWQHYKETSTQSLPKHLIKPYQLAISAQTGIRCFDHWVTSIRNTGYLHNHARMWFASIWIFTLNLPWEKGAAFFYKYLLDADPASNTLSWRWVAGLHTNGKHYLARADNINKYTQGQFHPVGQLNESADAIYEDAVFKKQTITVNRKISDQNCAFIITSEDYSQPQGIISKEVILIDLNPFLAPFHDDYWLEFHSQLLTDFQDRNAVQALFAPLSVQACVTALNEFSQQKNITSLVMFELGIGEAHAFFSDVQKQLENVGIRLTFITGDWDSKTWPLANSGFFQYWKKLKTSLC